MTDQELIRRFVHDRDEQSFRELYRRHTPALYGLLRRLAGPAIQDADDALQDAWMRAAFALASFRGESAFRTWLTGIAINCFRERLRSARRAGQQGSEPPDGRAPSIGRSVDIADVLSGLSPAHREVLVLHDVEGYTHEEIAGALGIEPGTSKSRLSRARQLFRERWRAAPIRPVGEAT